MTKAVKYSEWKLEEVPYYQYNGLKYVCLWVRSHNKYSVSLCYVHALKINPYSKINKYTNVKITFCTHNLSEIRQVSNFLDHLQGVTEHQ